MDSYSFVHYFPLWVYVSPFIKFAGKHPKAAVRHTFLASEEMSSYFKLTQ